VVRLANEHMARALRVISVERGHDPRAYTLLCFGGAGGLHACELAELLGMRRVLMPALGGVLSAFGMLASEPGRDLSQPVLRELGEITEAALEQGFLTLEQKGREELVNDDRADPARLRCKRTLELRYLGQSATLDLPWQPGADLREAFHRAHQEAAGHRLERPVELVNLRVSVRGPAPLDGIEASQAARDAPAPRQVFMPELRRTVPVIARRGLKPGQEVAGPAVITDTSATTWLPRGWQGAPDAWGNLVLEPGGA